MENKYNKEKADIGQIVLQQLSRILEISSHELRDTTTTILHSSYSSTTIQEDTRESYMQAIENLAYILIPYFDDIMKKVYDECIVIINAWGYEIKKEFEEEYDNVTKEITNDKIGIFFNYKVKLRCAKKLFCELNMLLHRNDYLKSAVYGESGSEEIVEDE